MYRKIVSRCNETHFNDVVFEFSFGSTMDVDYSFVALSLKKHSNSIGFLAIRGRSTIMLSEFFLLFLLQLFYLQLTFQRRKLRQTFIHSFNRVFTTNTVEGALTTVRSIRSFAVQALTFNCVK